MSTIDLKSGYWQVGVKSEDQDKTAFVTPFGTFRFKRMPFGLRNAPATFQRLIDRFRSSSTLRNVTILGNIDDLIVISDSFEQHLIDLRAVFDRLREFNLHANRPKCVFAKETVKYLGHIITPQGIAPDPDKINAIVDMKEPTTVKHLKSFLQTRFWFRKFVPNFSPVAQPLTMLTKKNQSWKWEEAHRTAFHELKRSFTSPPILIQPNYDFPFVLRTDASDYALGAALLQGETPHDERPIAYASRLLTSAERNYSTTEREALAVVWAVEKFRGFIDGHPVHVGSDHQPLKWLLTLKSPAGRLVRWAMKLQSFNLRVSYTPGKANVLADSLSRPPFETEARESCDVCTVLIDTPRWEATAFRKDQLDDPELSKIIIGLENTNDLEVNRWTERGYHMCKGVLYRYTDTETEEPQLVVPENRRKQVMVECHDSATAGHGGINKTLHRISQQFYFPGMRRYVINYLKTCVECQRYIPDNLKPMGLLQTPVPAQRFEVVAVDLFGPLPKGPKGERWVMIMEDTASKWTESFPLADATAEACAKVLIEEVFLRFGVPRRMVSDNGVQFVADVMQKAMFILGVKQNLNPLYHLSL
ncbi:Retrovirus-related Pol polyprotein from transposon 17.6 [Eumeta japonica]|uniref:RNA-directed DNA polymerase n=1 Tax=Eumeta variegata TaxID=151549 RepID=A0A4C1X885_EUMVA|nr:Retrovirus-related Pol polyprotein from transposon 17.6 [Eumeta japonica]